MTDMTYEPMTAPEQPIEEAAGSELTEATAPDAVAAPPVTPASDGDGQPDEAAAETVPTEAPSKTDPPPTETYAIKEAEDLIALRAQFPELSGLTTLRELNDPARYGELRDLGLSAREAYLATGGQRPQRTVDNRAHLHSAVPRSVHGMGDGISPAELSAARELFAGLSDHEIRRLYKRVSG